ncbi:cell adhesion molecule 2-like [Anneissia japonica]|uniref:cell adhesion molecule 2-like n=1 Tax=Anneissia japonica TaxID=1529436 RepID=UPI0014254E22|nr:cell adhesion molecule 2-like [Anneissia japonica]XP_033120437.1 cell adhesion molecule 2-like [Anneissia japonica]
MAQTGIYRLVVIIMCALKAVVLAGRFSGTPQDTEVVESNNALYTCTVQSLNDNEHINFTKDGVVIKSEEQPWERFKIKHVDDLIVKLTITLVTRSDHGEYSCQIRTNTGDVVETSPSGMLTVLEIPGENFPTCSSSKRYYVVGDTVELKCTSEETNPLPQLHWGLDPDIKNPYFRNSTNNGMFSLHYNFVAKQSDNGKSFMCTLNTPVDATINKVCNFGPLSIQYAPNVTVISQEYYTGQEMVLICSAEGNPYPTSFSWSFSHTLEESQYEIENNNQILRLENLKLEDNNLKAECTATNPVGSRSAEFTVTFKSQQTTSSSFEGDGAKVDGNAFPNTSDVPSESLVVVLAIIFICLFFVVLVLVIPICVIKLHKRRSDMNPNQRELPPQPTGYYDQFNNFHIGNDHIPNQNNIGYKTMSSSNGSENNFPIFESRTLPLSHRLPQSNISQDSWVMTLPLRPHADRKLTRHRSVEIQVSEDSFPIYEEVGKARCRANTESKCIMTDSPLNNYGRAENFLENIHEENGIEQKEKSKTAKSPELNPELIVYAKTEFV